MARQEISLGTAPTGVGGDTTRTTGVKINAMTLELYGKLTAANVGVTNDSVFVGVNLNPDNFLTGGQVLGQFVIDSSTVTGYLVTYPGSSSTVCGQTFMNSATGGISSRVKNASTWSKWDMLTGMLTDPVFNINYVNPILGSTDRFFSTPETSGDKPFSYGWVRTLKYLNDNYFQYAYEAVATSARTATRVFTNGAWSAWYVQYGTSNTTRAADGTLKAI